MSKFGKRLGYTDTPCPNCGRYRLELYENNKRVCEKCEWCVEDEKYVNVWEEWEEDVLGEYLATYCVNKEYENGN